jgi:hypothetical protein
VPIDNLASLSAHVLSATLLMNPPASQHRPRPIPLRHGGGRPPRPSPKRPHRTWRAWLKAVARPFIPARYRSRVRLAIVSSLPVTQSHNAATRRRSDESRRAA